MTASHGQLQGGEERVDREVPSDCNWSSAIAGEAPSADAGGAMKP